MSFLYVIIFMRLFSCLLIILFCFLLAVFVAIVFVVVVYHILIK